MYIENRSKDECVKGGKCENKCEKCDKCLLKIIRNYREQVGTEEFLIRLIKGTLPQEVTEACYDISREEE